MADQDPDLSQAEKRLKESLTATGKIARDITNKAFKELIASVNVYADQLKRIDQDLEEQLDRYSDIKDVVRGLGEELKKHATALGKNNDVAQGAKNIYNALNKISSKLVDNQEELVLGQLASKDVAKDLNKALSISSDIQKRLADARRQEGELEDQLLQARRTGTQDEIDAILDKRAALDAISQALYNQQGALTDITANLQEQLESATKIETKVGLGGKLLSGFKKIPVLGDMLDLDGAQTAMQATAAQGGSAFKVMGSGIKALGPALTAALGPLALIQIAIEGVKMLVEIMFQVDKQVTNIAHNLSISKDEAQITRKYYAEMSHSLESQYKSLEDIMEAQNQLNGLTSLSLMHSGKIIDNQIMMTKELGLSEQEAAQLNSTFATNTEEGQKSLDIVYDQIAAYANQNKMLFNGRKVLSEMSKVSGQVLASFKGSTAALANAVMRVDKLGLSLDKAKSISESMLDFESSIQSQMEAELLTGRSLNLDRARALALQGDYAGVAEEISREAGNYDQFSKMNVIQQQAIAKAVGMSADELADSLRKQKLITGESKAQIERLKEAGNVERANAIEKGILEGKTLKDAEKSVDAEEKFNQAIKEAKEIFSNLVNSGTLDKLVDSFKSVVEFLAGAKKFGTLLGESISFMIAPITLVLDTAKGIGKIFKGDLIGGIKDLGMAMVKYVLSPFKMIAATIDFLFNTNIASKFPGSEKPAEEGGKEAGGKKEIKTKDYVIKSLPEDTVVGAGGTSLGNTKEMLAELKQQNQLLAALLAKNTAVQIDGQVVANVVAKNAPMAYGNLLNPSSRAYG